MKKHLTILCALAFAALAAAKPVPITDLSLTGYLNELKSGGIFTIRGNVTIADGATLTIASGGTLTAAPGSILNGISGGGGGTTYTFTASDFNESGTTISLDYANAQAASGSTKGMLTSSDWTTFNAKVPATRTVNAKPLSADVTLNTGDLSDTTDKRFVTDAQRTILQGSTASFTTAEQTKLAGIAAGATVNSSDAQLRDRATHTGTQAIGTVTGLQAALDAKAQLVTPNVAVSSSVIDVTQQRNEHTVTGAHTWTKSATTTTGQKWGLVLFGDSVDRVQTIPSSYSLELGSTITSFTLRAGAKVELSWVDNGAEDWLIGVPTSVANLATLTPSGSTNVLVNNGTVDGKAPLNVLGDSILGLSANGIVKRTGANAYGTGVAGTDFAPPTSGTAMLKGNGSGGFADAVGGTDFEPARTTVSQAEAEAGTGTTVRGWTPQRVKQAIDALAPGGGGSSFQTGMTIFKPVSGPYSSVDSGWSLTGVNGIPALTSPDADYQAHAKVAGTVATPTASPTGDTYGSTQSVTITSATSGSTIAYTTNGTTPSRSVGTTGASPLSGVSISATVTLKAMAFKDFSIDSGVMSEGYTITGGGGDATTGLVANWDFNENTGATATDSVASNVLTFGGSYSWATAHAGASAAGFASNGWASSSTNALAFTSGDFTVGFWLQQFSFGDSVVPIYAGSYNTTGWYIEIQMDGTVEVKTNQAGAHQVTSTAAGAFSAGAWHHIAVTRSGAAIKIYVDGIDATSAAGTHIDPADASGNSMFIGMYNSATSGVNGRMDQLRVYGRTLTATDVTALYGL